MDVKFHTAHPYGDFVRGLARSIKTVAMKEKEDEHDTRLSSYLRLVTQNSAFGTLFFGELVDNVSSQSVLLTKYS